MKKGWRYLGILVFISVFILSCSKGIVPDDFEVPLRFENEHFIIRPIKASDAEMDYEAVMESIDIIHKSLLSDRWPPQDFTIKHNMEQILIKEKQFNKKKSFTYAVLSPDERRILGSVYINRGIGGPEAAVFMWIRKSEFNQGMDPVLEETVKKWIKNQWPFEYVVYPGRATP